MTKEIKLGCQIFHYRKIGMRWCKLEKLYGKRDHHLKKYMEVYKLYMQDGGKPILDVD